MEYPFKDLMPLDEATARDGYYKDWTHIDADTFHQISELVKFVREKGYGSDTREAIAQALERVYHDAMKSGNADMELSMARKHFKDLASRLDASDDILTSATAQLAQTAATTNELSSKFGELGAVATFKGSDTNANILAKTGMQVGDEWYDTTNQVSLRWNGSAWIDVGGVASLGDESVTREKIASQAVTARATNFLNHRLLNLYNYRLNVDGVRFATNGAYVQDATVTSSDYIEVEAGDYEIGFRDATKTTAIHRIPFYDDEKKFIQTLPEVPISSGSKLLSISIPSKGYIRVSVNLDLKRDVYIAKSTEAKGFVPYADELEKEVKISAESLSGIGVEQVKFIEKINKFTTDDGLINYVLNNSGKVGFFSGYNTTRFISLTAGQYNLSRYRRVIVYDSNYNFEREFDNTAITAGQITLETDSLVRVSIPSSDWIGAKIVRSEFDMSDTGAVLSGNIRVTPTSLTGRFSGRKLIQFGDSITANYPEISNTLNQRLGVETLNFAIGGAKMAERNDVPSTVGGGHTANSGIRIAEAIISGDFSDQYLYTNETYTGATLSRMLNTLSLIESTDLSAVTYATVQFGANDYLQGVPIGDLNSDRYTYVGAYKLFIETLSVAYPNLRFIIVSTPIIFSAQPSTCSIADYVEASRLVAEHFNFPFVENYKEAGINALNRYQYFNTQDGVHPDVAGRLHLGHRIASGIEANY